MLSKDDNKQRVNFFVKQASWFVLAAIMFCIGFISASYFSHKNVKQMNILSQSSANLVKENQALIESYNQQKIALDISTISLRDTQTMLEQAIKRESELERQVEFYQRVMTPAADKDGFFVEHAEVTETLNDNAYQLNLVLIQNRKFKDVVSGKLTITLIGLSNGKFKSYPLSQISQASQSFDYAFRYFQQKDIPFVLPQTFIPDRFEITTDVYKLKKKRYSYSTTLKWEEVVSKTDNT